MPFLMLMPVTWQKMLKDEGIEIPMVTTLHGTDITLGNHPLYKPAVSFSINKSDIVNIFLSEAATKTSPKTPTISCHSKANNTT
jgi:hypothetical protein